MCVCGGEGPFRKLGQVRRPGVVEKSRRQRLELRGGLWLGTPWAFGLRVPQCLVVDRDRPAPKDFPLSLRGEGWLCLGPHLGTPEGTLLPDTGQAK